MMSLPVWRQTHGDFHTATNVKIDENSPRCAEVSVLNTDSKYIWYQRIKYRVREMDYSSTLLLFSGVARTSRWFVLLKNLKKFVLSWQEQKKIKFWPGLSGHGLMREAMLFICACLDTPTSGATSFLKLLSLFMSLPAVHTTLCNFCRFLQPRSAILKTTHHCLILQKKAFLHQPFQMKHLGNRMKKKCLDDVLRTNKPGHKLAECFTTFSVASVTQAQTL